jgi:hypothetical protein
MSATDIQQTQDYVRHVDSAMEAAAEGIDKLTNRRFYNNVETHYWDWPNFQRAYPWRVWFDENELADVTVTTPVVTTGATVIPSSAVFWGPWNYAPPYNYLELNRATAYSFGVGDTPQRDVTVTGNFGYWTQSRTGGALAAAVSDTTSTAVTVTDASATGADVGDVISVDDESMLVSDNAMVTTGQMNVSGITAANASDNVLGVTDGTQMHAGEVVQIDAEWMMTLSVTGDSVTVLRAYGGTTLATHPASSTVYALRLLTVIRGFGGTTAATHLDAAPVMVQLVPREVRELAIGESLNFVLQKTSGYARTIGENSRPVPGSSLPDLRNRVTDVYTRKLRTRVV